MSISYIDAKTIVTRNKNTYWFGTDYNMNIYRGCCHGCIYCDSRSECYRIDDFDKVRAKSNALTIIEHELSSKRNKGTIATGSMSDPYNPFEQDLELTRRALMLADKYRFGIAIATKSPLVTRDIDILSSISQHSPVIVKLTITTADDSLCKQIERNVAVSSQRFHALAKLSEAGIYAGVLMMPLLPFINDSQENTIQIVNNTKSSGGKFIFGDCGLTLRDNQKQYYYQMLEKYFTDIREKYKYIDNNQYHCMSPHYKTLSKFFKDQCKQAGILFNMNDIIKDYKHKYKQEQLTLF